MIHIRQVVSSYYINNQHNSDALYFSLTRLILISDEGCNLKKVDSVLQAILLMWLNNANFTNCAQKSTMSQLCTLFNNLSQIDRRENPLRTQVMKTTISALLFYIEKARALNLYKDIRLSSEDFLVLRALLSVTSEYVVNDQTGLETLLTCIKEMLQFARDPASHCMNADDFSLVAMTIDPNQFERTLQTATGPLLNQLK